MMIVSGGTLYEPCVRKMGQACLYIELSGVDRLDGLCAESCTFSSDEGCKTVYNFDG
jgi:hypothetical protein